MKSIFWVFSLALTCFASGVSVFTLDEQYTSSNMTALRFKVVNNTGKSLKNVELHYKVVQKTGNIAPPDIYFLPSGSASWKQIDGVQTLVVKFPNVTLATGNTLCGDAGCAIGIHNTDWSLWTKNDDPSQPVGNTFALNNNIEVVADGLESIKPQEVGCPEIRFVEVMKDTVSLEILQQKASDSKKLNLVGEKGVIASVDLNNAKTDSLGRKIWRGAAPVQDGVRGEFWAECNGKMLSYFAYGWIPQKAKIAVANKLWSGDSSFVKADFDMGFNQGLGQGQRLLLNADSNGVFADARVPLNWKFYRAWEEPGENQVSTITTPFLMRYGQNDIDSLDLSWSFVDGADWYHLVIMKDSVYGDTLVSLFTQQNSLKIPSPGVGSFVWFAEPMVEVAPNENDSNEIYYTVSEDAALYSATVSDSTNVKPVLKLPSFKKVKKWAKKTALKALEYALSYVEYRLNPLGVIQIFTSSETLRTSKNDVVKNMSMLQYSYVSEYVYYGTTDSSKYSDYLSNPCFGKDAFCAMKDTRMIVEKWNNGFNAETWNKIFPKKDANKITNDPVHNRCWLTMAQMINHYKGGNISTDEILYAVRGGLDDTTGSENLIDIMSAVSYALNQDAFDNIVYTALVNSLNSYGNFPSSIAGWVTGSPFPSSVMGWFSGSPPLHVIIETIESGNVLGVCQKNAGYGVSHAMVLNGYKICMNGDVYIHLLNTDNMGNDEWRYYCNLSFADVEIVNHLLEEGAIHLSAFLKNLYDDSKEDWGDAFFFSYYVPPLYASGRSSDERVFGDSDNDGIVDFDEIERFDLDPNKNDTDGDGLLDYDELLDYKLCENEGKAKLSSFSYVAKHRDSDGDGFCDIQENGHEVEGVSLCERYDASRHPEGVEPECSVDYNLAMLATELVQMNDRAYCVDLQGNYCPIASYDSDGDSPYGVVLGVQAKVGNVYSAKSVFLRDYSVVYGNVETDGVIERQSSTPLISGIATENSDQKKLYDVIYAPVLENAVLDNVNFTTENYRAFNTNETAIASRDLGIGAANTGFIFNSYSQLIVDGNQRKQASGVQFQAGAKLNVLSGSLEMHVGKNFQWNGEIIAENMIKAAQNIIVYYYGTETVYVQTNFAGTIVAPNAEIVVGQAYGKRYYGAIFAKRIVVHQNTEFTWVPYSPSVYESIMAYNVSDKYIVKF